MIVDWEDLIDRDDVHGSMRTIALVVTYFTGQEITIKRKIHEAIGAAMFRAPFGLNPKGVTLYSRILARGVKTLMGEESEGVYMATGEYGSIERRSSYDPLSVHQQSHVLDIQDLLTSFSTENIDVLILFCHRMHHLLGEDGFFLPPSRCPS